MVWKNYLYWVLAGVFALVLLWFCQILLLPLLFAVVLVYILLPAVVFLECRKIPTSLAIIFLYVGIFALGVAGFYVFLPRFFQEISALSALIPEYVGIISAKVENWYFALPETLGIEAMPQLVGDMVERMSTTFLAFCCDFFGRGVALLPSAFADFFTTVALLVFSPIIAFYILRDREKLADFVAGVLPNPWEAVAWQLARDLNVVFRGFIGGYFALALVVGGIFGGALWFLGVEYALTLGAVMCVAELVPYIGPFLGFFPCLLLVAVQGQSAIVAMLVVWALVQQLENLVLTPRIMGAAVDLHPLAVMLAVLVGGYWFGVLGMILAVPVLAVVPVLWRFVVDMRSGEW